MISSLLKILDKKDRLGLYYLIVLNIFATVLEILSIGIIFPVIIFLIKPFEEISQNLLIKNWIDVFNIENQIELVFFSLLIIFIIFFIKTIFLFNKTFVEGKFIFNLRAKISTSLLTKYLNLSLMQFNKLNSSIYIQNTINVTNQFVQTVIMPMITLLPEILAVLGIIFFLIFIELKATFFSIVIVILPAYIFFKIFKKRIQLWGKFQQYNEKLSVFNLNQSLGSIKDIKVYNAENYFINKFRYFAQLSSFFMSKAHILRIVSRYFLELIAVIGLITFIYVSLVAKNFIDIIPIIGLFFAAIIRLLPSVNRIILSFQLLRYGKEHIKILTRELNNHGYNKDIKKKNLTFKKFIKFSGVKFFYNKKNLIFNNLNLLIQKNSIVGISGVTGSGKSTFINLLLGLYIPKKGKILIDNKKLKKNYQSDWLDKISYVSQSVVLLDDSILKNIAFANQDKKIDFKRAKECSRIAELDNFINKLPKKFNTIVGDKGINLSGGQIQRIGLARALYKYDTELLILDEATSSLDLITEAKVVNNLKKYKNNKTIVIISHRKKILEVCSEIYELRDKKFKLKKK